MSETERKFPQHDKLKALNGRSQTVGDFIQWFQEKGWTFAEYDDAYYGGEVLKPVSYNLRDLIAEFFNIDQRALEQEKQAMIDDMAGLIQHASRSQPKKEGERDG